MRFCIWGFEGGGSGRVFGMRGCAGVEVKGLVPKPELNS